MADSDLFMECEEEELEPWQQIHENVQTERMETFESISTVKQVTDVPTVVTRAPATARVPAPVPVVSTHMVLSGQTLSGNSQDTRVSLLTNPQSLVTPLGSVSVPITLPTGLPKPDQGQQLIFTQGAGGLSTVALSQVLLSAPGPCPSGAANQPIILTTQGLPVQNLMAGQNPLGIVLNVQQGQTIKPITLVSGGRRDVVHQSFFVTDAGQTESGMDKLESKLSEQIRLNRHLYDTSMREHRDFLRIQKSWKEIAEALGKDEAVCRKMWKNLRDKFVRMKKRSERRCSGYRPSPLMRELAWLTNFVKHREMDTNLPNETCNPASNGGTLRIEYETPSSSVSTVDTCDMSVTSTNGEVSRCCSSPCQPTSPGTTVLPPIVTTASLPSLPTLSTATSSSSLSSTSLCVSSPPSLEKMHLKPSALVKLCDDRKSFQQMLLDKLGQPQEELSSLDLYFQFLSRMVKDQVHPDHHLELQQRLLQTVAEYIKKPSLPSP